MHTFFRTLPRHIAQVFHPRYLPYHVLAIVLTATIVYTGLDWAYFVDTKELYPYFFGAVVIGGLVPLLVPLVLIVFGHLQKKIALIHTGWVLWQAALVGWLVSSTYKAFTGRIQPNLGDYVSDISNGFQFGFFRHGIFWGWPSSHTSVAFAMSIAFVTLYPKKRVLCVLAILYAFFVGLGVSMSIHWLSDAVAGVLIGSVCGLAVGKGYKKISTTFYR